MMDKYLELIWKKLDGDISTEEQKIFDLLYKTKNDFKSLYKEQSIINNSLRRIPLHKAPPSLLVNVMQSIGVKHALSQQYSSFSGLKTICIFFGGFTILLCVWYLSVKGIQIDSGNSSALGSLISEMFSKLGVPASMKTYLPYSLVPIAAMALFWLDAFLKKSRLSYNAIF
jgi:hypothetical protein